MQVEAERGSAAFLSDVFCRQPAESFAVCRLSRCGGLPGGFSMNEQPKLSDAEWALLIDLLQQERDQLPVEIHHTRSTAFRGELQRRRQMVETLLERLRAPVGC